MKTALIRPMTDEYAEYLRDESRTVGHAESISFPKNEEEVLQILNNLRGSGTQVTIQGARTGLAAAAVPNSGHVMNLSRMDAVIACRMDDRRNFFLTVQPGVILSQLKKRIEGKKFDLSGWSDESQTALAALCQSSEHFFPTDPTESSATLGGMVACNASGARSFKYGPTRKHISGLRVVLADGRTIVVRRGETFAEKRQLTLNTEQGDRFTVALPSLQMPKVKNASGYYIEDNMDAIDLFIGSDGTLGVITEIEIALSPLPPVIWGVSCFFENELDCIAYVAALRQCVPDVAAIEFFDGDALVILRDQKANNPAFFGLPVVDDRMSTVIYVELHCTDEAAAAERLFQIGALLEKSGSCEQNSWVARTQADLDRLQFFRHAIPESVNMLIDKRKQIYPTITKLGTDMAVPDEHLPYIMEMYRKALKEKGLESAIWGHIGDNHLHVNILPRNTEDYLRGKELYAQWAAEVTGLGGAVSAEHGVGKLKANFLTVMYGEKHISEMAALKEAFDPEWILGVGNLFTPPKGGRE